MIKTPDELVLMRNAGRLLAQVFEMLDRTPQAGMTTLEADTLVDRYISVDLAARPASKGQYGYGHVLNCSINQVVCHGVPSADVTLKDGDIVNLDITLEKDGFIADASKEAMWKGIDAVRPGARLGDVGHAIERYAKRHGYSIVRDYCGHGIGREMHEEPAVPAFGRPGTGLVLREGMTFTIEPMLNQGSRRTVTLDDEWTVVTADGRLSAQFEHTVAVTATGVEVLTLRAGERHAS